MFKWLRNLLKRERPTAETHCMVMSCPMDDIEGFGLERVEDPENCFTTRIPSPSELPDDVREKVISKIDSLLEEFADWVGTKEFAWNLMSGFTTIFFYAHTVPPTNPERESFGPINDTFLADMCSFFVLGDKGTQMAGKSFSKKFKHVAEKWGR